MTRAGRKDRPVPPGRRTKRRRIRPLRSTVLAFLQAVFGMEREEVAKITGLKASTIGYLEQGKEEPRLAILVRLVTRMRVSRELLEDLLDLAEEMRGRWTAD
ncbi:MAG TPA: helix-turn-helix transcriptional regulator [Thermoanaerobaculia bacterium]|jgi:transcriptional regulator with XRE-family HTH domain|nr:helix-turn-helix transcriptional regulator [Thermoanaerobaculia bacterium]